MSHHVIGIERGDYRDGLSPEERAAVEPEREPPSAAEVQAEREDLKAILADGEQQARERAPFPGPMLPVEPVENFDDRVAAIDAQRAEIRAQRRDGDIDFDDAEQQLEALAAQRQDLVLQQRDAEQAYQHNERIALTEWTSEVERFAAAHPEYAQDQVLWDALDATVKRLANEQGAEGHPVNADRAPAWFLEEAHRLVSARAAQEAHRDREHLPGRKASETEPAREHSSGDVTRDALDLEQRLARLRPDQVDHWLRTGEVW